MTASTGIKAVMVIVSGHSQKNPCFSGIVVVNNREKTRNLLVHRLNPCFSGIVVVYITLTIFLLITSLNPCFSGIVVVNIPKVPGPGFR